MSNLFVEYKAIKGLVMFWDNCCKATGGERNKIRKDKIHSENSSEYVHSIKDSHGTFLFLSFILF